jgi:hypothetical protein
MTNIKVSALPVAGAITGAEQILLVQSSSTKITTPSALATYLASILAPLASPALTGTPTAPTAAPGNNSSTIANTAFVTAAVGSVGGGAAPLASPAFTGNPTAPTPSAGDNDTSISTTAFVTTAVAAATTGLAALASPILTGNPTAPTPAVNDNDTSIATTAFVTAADVVAVAAAASSAASLYAPKISPIFTGNPTAPTPSVGDNDTSVATTAFVTAADVVAVAAAATSAASLYATKISPTLTTPNLGAAVATSVAADTFTTTTNNVNGQSTTAYTFQNSDNGKTVIFSSASAIAASLNTGLTAGWNANVIVSGAGQLTIGGTATKNNRNGLKSAGQNAMLTISYGGATDTYFIGGDTAP